MTMHHRLEWVCSMLCKLGSIAYVIFMLKQFFRPDPPMLLLPLHVFATIAIVLAWKPFAPNLGAGWGAVGRLFDLGAIISCAYIIWHYFEDTLRIQNHLLGIDDLAFGEMFAFCVGVPLMLEAVRRTTGLGLVVLLLVFIGYGFFGGLIPGWFRFDDFDLRTFTELAVLGNEGLFGVTASAMTTFVFYFIFFGAIFAATKGGGIFIDIAMRVAGTRVGGPAKTSIIGSSLFSLISGSALANVTSTGVLTIPLMKRAGYSPEQAAAIEAIGSAGGQLMPPIMGVAAFVMADLVGIPYSTIALAGIIPSIAFYFALYICVDLMARKKRIGGSREEELRANSTPIGPRLHLLLSPIALIAALVSGYSAPMAALVGSAVALLVPWLRKNTRYTLRMLYDTIWSAGRQMADISVTVTSVGIIILIAIQSGLAIKFVTLMAELGKGNLAASLLLVVLGCVILGMGLPTVAAYVIGAIMFVPALTSLGVEKLPAHFFVMYYSVLSQVTPPVPLCVFAASAIAKSNPYKTAWLGMGLGLSIFVLPFGFIHDKAMLWQGSYTDIAIAGGSVLCATGAWAIALQGWFAGGVLRWPLRILFGVCCLVIIYMPTFSAEWFVAFAAFLAMFVAFRFAAMKRFIHRRPAPLA